VGKTKKLSCGLTVCLNEQNLGFEYMRFITILSCFHEEPFREAVLQALELSSARRLPLQFLQLNGFVCICLFVAFPVRAQLLFQGSTRICKGIDTTLALYVIEL
jgi:hypothetical protein